MDVLTGVVAGLVQGTLEWLPVSSSGQSMLFFLEFAGLEPGHAFELGIFLHLGTMLAVFVKYSRTWTSLLRDRFLKKFLFVTTAFTGLVGVPAYAIFKVLLRDFDGGFFNFLIGFLLVVTGILLYASKKRKFAVLEPEGMSFAHMAAVGAMQGLSILPGVSRSGATVSALAISGVGHEQSLRLSFLMSVPAVAGAVALEASEHGFGSVDAASLAGLFAAFASGYLFMEALLAFAHRLRFDIFCLVFGVFAMASSII